MNKNKQTRTHTDTHIYVYIYNINTPYRQAPSISNSPPFLEVSRDHQVPATRQVTILHRGRVGAPHSQDHVHQIGEGDVLRGLRLGRHWALWAKKKCEGWGSWTRVKSDFHSKCWRVLLEIKHGHMGPYCVYILGFAESNMSRMSLITTEATWGFALLFHTPDKAHRKFSRQSRICTYYWHTTRLKHNPINLFIFNSNLLNL